MAISLGSWGSMSVTKSDHVAGGDPKANSLPAANLGLDRRGLLKNGYFADVAIFDPNTIADKAT